MNSTLVIGRISIDYHLLEERNKELRRTYAPISLISGTKGIIALMSKLTCSLNANKKYLTYTQNITYGSTYFWLIQNYARYIFLYILQYMGARVSHLPIYDTLNISRTHNFLKVHTEIYNIKSTRTTKIISLYTKPICPFNQHYMCII